MTGRGADLPWKICVTSSETDIASVRRRIGSMPEHFHEVRLDFLEPFPEDIDLSWCASPGIVVTLRPRREGGRFSGSEARRVAILLRAVEAGAGFVDIEFSTPGALRRRLYAAAGRKTKIILSYHDFRGIPAGILSTARRMEKEPAHVVKIALASGDARDLGRLLRIAGALSKPRIIVGMGAGGLVTRILPERFGSILTYAAAAPGLSTAEGQLTPRSIDLFRAGRGLRPALLGLIGDRGALGSHGLSVYNMIFARRALPFVYLPVITSSLRRALPALRALGLAGASVTQPHKMEAMRLCDRVADEARLAGAVNTLKFRRGEILGFNTDYLAARRIFRRLGRRASPAGHTAAIVGAGGAARAVAAALSSEGWKGAVFNRTPEPARLLARRFGLEVRPLRALEECAPQFDLLVNCTSVGMDSDESVIADPASLKEKIVMDLVSHPVETKLLRQARSVGAMTICGTHFWALQGREQMNILISENFKSISIENMLLKCEYLNCFRI